MTPTSRPSGQFLFPERFAWGAATSAYQVEGSPLTDGAGPSTWHRFSHTPGRVLTGETGDVACDHYRRWRDDVRLMRELGLSAYRLSVSWSRVLPEGTGRVNEKGLDFYRRLADGLAEAGIAPFVTLFHWDLPAALDDRGGWLNRDVAGWFAEYAEVLYRALDDRVAWWATLNEPWVVSDGGYLHGTLAPGHASVFEAPIASHNLLRAHGAAVAAYRSMGRHGIGVVVNLEPKHPASRDDADIEATARADAYMNRQFLDPIFLGSYSDELPRMYGEAWPAFPPADLDAIRVPIDFLGINYYSRGVMRDDPSGLPPRAARVRQPASLHTEMEWEVYPPGLDETLSWVKKRYGGVPLYVTENGAAFADPPAQGGAVHDPLRVTYLRDHLRAAHAAISAGVDLRGYFVWSLLDNFEWNHGTSKRFGIVHVDFATQRRTPKDSARFYAEIVRTNGGALAGE
ncbi:MAG TPA: GH1 family beta-glucosidase [Thermoanaerobaculaceae bacterium]|nr:GH1 family beta-glucosidase [Thermoanaerobaculaceae bacterium]